MRQYLKNIRKSDRKQSSLLNHKEGELRRDSKAKNSIITTWQISFKHIHKTRQSAAELLSLISFFDSQGISETLVRGRAGETEHEIREGRGDDKVQSDEDSDFELNNDDGFEMDVQTLRDFSFISTTSDPTVFEMHRLVQLATRKWLEANKQLEKWKEQYIKILYSIWILVKIRPFSVPIYAVLSSFCTSPRDSHHAALVLPSPNLLIQPVVLLPDPCS